MGTTPATQDAANASTGDDRRAADRQFVTFSVAGEMFAVPMAPVQEIIRVPEVARMPLAPPALNGLANLRGRVLPIVSLRNLFRAEPRAHDDATRALVIHLGQPLGFVVDRVASVIQVEAHEIEPATSIQSTVQAEYLTGVINRPSADGSRQLILVLDFQRLVEEQFQQVAAGVREAHPGPGGTERSRGGAEPVPQDEQRLVSFTVDGQEYAIHIAAVQEIVQVPPVITKLPHAASHVLGLMSLRQRLLPLVSLRGLFGMSPTQTSDHHRIVVVALHGGGQVGLVTDTVKEVLSVPAQLTEPVPEALVQGHQLDEFESICRLDQGKRLISVLSTERLLGMSALIEAAALADAPLPDATQENTMNNPAHPLKSDTGTDDDTQVVIFRLGAEEFGVPIMSVQEIVRVPEVLTRVPRTPRFVEGVINLRGTVLPVIDQRARLGMPTIERNDRQRIMVYTFGGQRTGFIVDSVAEVLRIGRLQIDAAPDLSDEQGQLITQVAKIDKSRLVMLIDPAQLLGSRELRSLHGMGQPSAAEAEATTA